MSAKEHQSTIVDWGLPFGLIIVCVGPWLSRFFLPEKAELSSAMLFTNRNAWHISICGLLGFVLMMFWKSFCKSDEIANELETIKSKMVFFKLDIYHPPQPDPLVEFWALRIKVTNSHPDTTAREVKVRLINISSNTWNTFEKSKFARKTNPPYNLPKKGDESSSEKGYDIPHNSTEEFDLLFIKLTGDFNGLGLAPFRKGITFDYASVESTFGILKINGYVGDQMKHRGTGDFDSKVLAIDVDLVCDKSEKICRTINLTVPGYNANTHERLAQPSFEVTKK